MKIKTIDNKVRLRRTPEFKNTNVARLLAKDVVFDNPKKYGDWWKVEGGYIHASMVIEIPDAPVPPPPPPTPPTSINVPFRSQWDTDASNRTSDCGQTCVAMLAQWKGITVRIRDLKTQSSGSGTTTPQDLIKNFTSINMKSKSLQIPIGQTPPLPAICLVWYGGFNRANVQDKGFRGWHWLILLEQTPTEVIVHDPDYFDKRRDEGAFKRYSLAEWNAAFIPYYAYSSTKRTVVVLDQ